MRLSLASYSRQIVEVSSSFGVEPRTILRFGKDSVRLIASTRASPSAVTSIASSSSMSRMRTVCARRLRGDRAALILSEPPGNRR